MGRASRGLRHSTRNRLKKRFREKLRIGDYLQEFSLDDRVAVKINPSSHRGMPHPRFNGKVGVITEKRGQAYVCELSLGNKPKKVIARPEHLRPAHR